MAMMTNTATNATTSGDFLTRLVSVLGDRLTKYGAYRRTVAELSSLNDRELRDFGANRSMIRSLAYEQAYRSM